MGIRFSLTPRYDYAHSQGDADCHVARPSLLAMTGQFSLTRRFRQNREALPLLGEVPSAHTGERGLRGRTRCRPEKTGRSATILFPTGTPSAMATPQSRLRSTAPLKGAPRAYTKAAALNYTSSAMNHAENGATRSLPPPSFRGGRSPTWESVSP